MNPKEYLQNLGRDGAYAEFDVEQLGEFVKSLKCDDNFPKMITLKCSRVEISDPDDVDAFKKFLFEINDSEEFDGLSPTQIGLLIFLKAFKKGIR